MKHLIITCLLAIALLSCEDTASTQAGTTTNITPTYAEILADTNWVQYEHHILDTVTQLFLSGGVNDPTSTRDTTFIIRDSDELEYLDSIGGLLKSIDISDKFMVCSFKLMGLAGHGYAEVYHNKISYDLAVIEKFVPDHTNGNFNIKRYKMNLIVDIPTSFSGEIIHLQEGFE